jgi:hypothetical protein
MIANCFLKPSRTLSIWWEATRNVLINTTGPALCSKLLPEGDAIINVDDLDLFAASTLTGGHCGPMSSNDPRAAPTDAVCSK